MQDFPEFLRKYSRLLLFLFLTGVSFVLIFLNNNYQNVLFFNAMNTVTGSVYSRFAGVTEYLYLKNTNDLLAKENAELRAQLLKDKYRIYSKSIEIKDTSFKQVYRYIPANIINNSVDKANNYITLDVGSIHGIKPDMGVICGDGVVGIIKTVSEHFSVANSVLHTKSTISAGLQNSKYFGSLQWDGLDPNTLTLSYIPSYAILHEGDTVETTGYSSIFPQGIMVGTVKGLSVNADEGYFNLKLRPSVDFRKVRKVYVVNYLLKEEQQIPEKEAAKDDK